MTSMLPVALIWCAVLLCGIPPAVQFCINLRRFRPPPYPLPEDVSLSVLIPARNEEENISAALHGVLASRGVDLEVMVWNDASTDRTGAMVRAIAARDPRVRLLEGQGLPPGWNGKQHACWRLAEASSRSLLVFLDADVRVEPDLLARMAAFQRQTGASLVSGFPRLVTVTFLERLLLPLIHFVLLAFLPMRWMRRRLWPSAAAGCGQFLMAERTAYFACGGHNAIRETMHDGLRLPKVFRKARFRTDIADITDLSQVRMYHSAASVWNGLAKNATEGIASPGRIVPLSLILLSGQVFAPLLGLTLAVIAIILLGMAEGLGIGVQVARAPAQVLFLATIPALLLAGWLPRLLAARRFHQPVGSALLHPLGIVVLLVLQWYALLRKVVGRPVGWRQRSYSSGTGAEQTS